MWWPSWSDRAGLRRAVDRVVAAQVHVCTERQRKRSDQLPALVMDRQL